MFEELDEKFDVVPTETEQVSLEKKTDIEDDAEHARETMHVLIDKGNEAIEGILHIAKNSEHPRAYEVAGQLIKTVSDVAKDLLDVQKKKKDLEGDTPTKVHTQNNLFVGSTHDLLKAMKQVSKSEEEIPEAEVEILDEQ